MILVGWFIAASAFWSLSNVARDHGFICLFIIVALTPVLANAQKHLNWHSRAPQ